ncbi:MAG: prepilin-type N-terminal cleavage/methylation domain-containing protein [bacterium]
MFRTNKKAFTLIEMLIVVVIIGILAAALIPRLASVQARARDTKRKADLHQIGVALGIYKQDHGGYDNFGGTDQDTNGTSYSVYANGGSFWSYNAGPSDDTYPITNTQQLANHYNNNQFLAYLPKLLRKYMTSVPMESNVAA